MKQFYLKIVLLGLLLGGSPLFAQVKIGDNIDTISPYALLELESTEQGLMIPRMTIAQRDAAFGALGSIIPQPGLIIFNTDSSRLEYLRLETDSSGKLTKTWQPVEGEETIVTTGPRPTDPEAGEIHFNQETSEVAIYNEETDTWITLTAPVQTLSISGNTLSISDGNSVDLTPFLLTAVASSSSGVLGHPGSGVATGTADPPTISANPGSVYVAIGSGNVFTRTSAGTWVPISTTDSQILSYGNTATSTQTTLNITNGNALNLRAGKGISFNQTGADTLEISGSTTSSGTTMHTTLRWDGTAWVENTALLSDGTATTTATTDVVVTGSTSLATTTLNKALIDGEGNAGTAGQILSATASNTTRWISPAQGLIRLETGNYNAIIQDGTILVQPVGPVTITLPTPTLADNGISLTVKRASTYTGPSDTLTVTSAAQFDQSTNNLNLNVSFQGYTLQAFAGQWYITQRF